MEHTPVETCLDNAAYRCNGVVEDDAEEEEDRGDMNVDAEGRVDAEDAEDDVADTSLHEIMVYAADQTIADDDSVVAIP